MGRLGNLSAGLAAVRSEVEGLSGPIDGLVAKLGEARTAVDRDAQQIQTRVERMREESSAKLDAFQRNLEEAFAKGDVTAGSLNELVTKVREGAIDADRVIQAFGNGISALDGDVRSIKDLLLDLLPSTGQVQAEINAFLDLAPSVEERLRVLLQGSNAAGRKFAELFQYLREGTADLSDLIAEAERLRRAVPGSEQSQIADSLIDELLGGGLG